MNAPRRTGPTYYCDREGSCIKKLAAGGAGTVAPSTGVLAPYATNPQPRSPQIFRPGGMLQKFQQQ
jgi:hypothetical protein